MTAGMVYLIWWVSLALLLVVTIVVALLLMLILRSARTILGVASEIWTHGKLVANNTIHIPQLVDTNRQAVRILTAARKIVAGAGVIEQHAEGCPGCPACVLAR